jgi:signal transduction histidine kinase
MTLVGARRKNNGAFYLREGSKCQFPFGDASSQPKPLTELALSALFRAARELLTNVAKHSQTRKATIRIERDADSVVVCVTDEGAGFEHGDLDRRGGEPQMGLRSLHDRLTTIGGSFEIRTRPGHGTVATVTAPLATGEPSSTA